MSTINASSGVSTGNKGQKAYPAGALLRVSDICGRKDAPGLLPIDRSTWHRWIKAGKVPEGKSLAGTGTKVWPIELVQSLAA